MRSGQNSQTKRNIWDSWNLIYSRFSNIKWGYFSGYFSEFLCDDKVYIDVRENYLKICMQTYVLLV